MKSKLRNKPQCKRYLAAANQCKAVQRPEHKTMRQEASLGNIGQPDMGECLQSGEKEKIREKI